MTLMNKLVLYFRLVRVSHWSKNLIIPFGFFLAAIYARDYSAIFRLGSLVQVGAAFLSASLVSSANYILNDVLDANSDKRHPLKMKRAVASETVQKGEVTLFMLFLFLAGFAVAISTHNAYTLLFLFLLVISSILYNVPPFRMKDIAFLDVVIESDNNPIRVLFGWYIILQSFPPWPVIVFLWVYAAVLMTAKRFSELLYLGSETARNYRPVFRVYTLQTLRYAFVAYSAASVGVIVYVAARIGMLFSLFALLLGVQLVWLYNLMYSKKEIVQKIENVYKLPAFLAYMVAIICAGMLLFIIVY